MTRKKLIIVIVGVMLAASLIFFASYYLANRAQRTSTKKSEKQSGALEKVSDQKTFFPALSIDGESIIYFNADQGSCFFKYSTKEGKAEKISEDLAAPEAVIYSPDRQKAILKIAYNRHSFELHKSPFIKEGAEDNEITNWLFEFNGGKITPLSSDIKNVVFSPSGQKILYHFYDEAQTNAIAASEPNGSNWQKIIDADAEDYGLSFLDENNLLYFVYPTDISGSNLYKINLKTKESKAILEDFSATDAVSSPDGKKIIYNTSSYLGLMATDDSNKKALQIKGSVFKTVFSSDSTFFIAAVPTGENKPDKLYKIDAKSGQETEVKYTSKDRINAKNLILSKDGKTLYFTLDDYLYKLELPI